MLLIWFCFPVLLCSCATIGHDFHPDLNAFALGKLKIEDCKRMLGEPVSESEKISVKERYEVLNYHFGQNALGSVRSRILIVEFKDGKLNAYVFTSSFDKDKTTVDLSKVDQLRNEVGKLTRDDIIAALGQPDGKALASSTLPDFKDQSTQGTEVWAWFVVDRISMPFVGSSPTKTAYIYVILDADGKVKDVQTIVDNGRIYAP